MLRVFALLAALAFLAGCTEPPVAQDPESSATASPTPSSSEVQNQSPPQEEVRAPLEERYSASEAGICRLKDARIEKRQPNNVGFPLSTTWIPVEGTAEFLVVPVTFADLELEDVPLTFIQDTADKVAQWYSSTSRGQLEVKFEILEDWVELGQPSTDFVFEKGKANVAPTEEDRIRNELQTRMTDSVVKALPDKSSIFGKDAMFMVFPNGATAIETSILQRGVDISSTSEVETMMVWGTGLDNPIRELEWALWIHEALHDQGLALHAPGNGSDFGLGQNQYAKSLTLTGWEQFKLGWIQDDNVLCLDAELLDDDGWHFNLGVFEILESKPNIAVIRLSDYEALVIESRRPVGYSETYPELKGAVVYKVDTRLDNDRASECCEDFGNDPEFDKWAFLLAPDSITNSRQSTGSTSDKFIFKEGDAVSLGNYRLTLTQSSDQDSFTFLRVD